MNSSTSSQRRNTVTKFLDFDCAVSEPIDLVATLPTNPNDPEQMVCIVHVTTEGIIMDFYVDGELIRTNGKTWDEWYETSPRAL